MRNSSTRTRGALAAVAVVVLAGSAVAVAETSVISADFCVKDKGQIRLAVDGCDSNEQLLTISGEQGPVGPAGPAGPQGETGPAGADGEPGGIDGSMLSTEVGVEYITTTGVHPVGVSCSSPDDVILNHTSLTSTTSDGEVEFLGDQIYLSESSGGDYFRYVAWWHVRTLPSDGELGIDAQITCVETS